MIKSNQSMVAELLTETKTQNDMLTDIAEGILVIRFIMPNKLKEMLVLITGIVRSWIDGLKTIGILPFRGK